MTTHTREIVYADDLAECAIFYVTENGHKWETCRAERGQRNVVQPARCGYWLDLPMIEAYAASLHQAIAWVRKEDPLFTPCKCGSGLPAINCDC